MHQFKITILPELYPSLLAKSNEIGFTMSSDTYVGSLLKTLVASKPNGNILELGTGIGLSLSWIIDGMDKNSKLISIDNDPKLIEIALGFFGEDPRVEFVCVDGTQWIQAYKGQVFDLVFADAWPGKYSEIKETLDLIKVGGFYVVDDMTPQTDWPEGHHEKAKKLFAYLESRIDFTMTKMNWSTGIIIMTRLY